MIDIIVMRFCKWVFFTNLGAMVFGIGYDLIMARSFRLGIYALLFVTYCAINMIFSGTVWYSLGENGIYS